MSAVKKPNAIKEISRVEHITRVYNDPDFTAELEAIRKELEQKYGSGVSFQVAEAGLAVYRHTGKSYISDIADQNRIKQFAADWLLELDDLVYYADGYHLLADHTEFRRNKKLKVGTVGNKVIIEIMPQTTLDDVIKSWQAVDYAKQLVYGAKRRQREAENYDLVYAVFKALKSGKDFQQIYKLYITEQLPGYDKENGHDKRLGDHSTLKKYYLKHTFILSDA